MNLKLVLAFAFTAVFAASVIMPAIPAMASLPVTCTPPQVLDTSTNTCITPPVTAPPGDSDDGEHEHHHHHDHGQKHHHEDRDE